MNKSSTDGTVLHLVSLVTTTRVLATIVFFYLVHYTLSQSVYSVWYLPYEYFLLTLSVLLLSRRIIFDRPHTNYINPGNTATAVRAELHYRHTHNTIRAQIASTATQHTPKFAPELNTRLVRGTYGSTTPDNSSRRELNTARAGN